MLAPRRRCLDYSKVDFDVTEKGLLACHQSKQITYYIYIYIYIYIIYGNSKFSIDHAYNSTDVLPAANKYK